MSTTFDPIAFKTTTRAQWETAAEAWHRWGPAIEAWLGAATERMLDDVHLAAGSRVLDVAAGAGGQTLAAARPGRPLRPRPGDRHLPGDPRVTPRRGHSAAGLGNVATLEADGEDLVGRAGTAPSTRPSRGSG